MIDDVYSRTMNCYTDLILLRIQMYSLQLLKSERLTDLQNMEN